MKQFNVTGMSCAACAVRVEKAVSKVEGVTNCAVSLLTNAMSVEGNAPDDAIIKAVTDAGYGASVKGQKDAIGRGQANALTKDRETPGLLKRFLVSLCFLIVLMYFSMGHGMWGWPVPSFFDNNPAALGLIELLLSAAVMIINKHFFISGYKSVLHGAPNMDTLIALGSSASFIWSTVVLFKITGLQAEGALSEAAALTGSFFFESAAMILCLITIGKILEAKSKGRTTNALKSLIALNPETATVIRDGKEIVIPAEALNKGDIFIVRPGEKIPADGVIIDGDTAVNEAALTGESLPVDKSKGSRVSAATINQSGFIRCEALRVGDDTALFHIIRLVEEAAATKAPIAKTADKVSGIFVPAVVLIALITLSVWLILGRSFDFALARAVSVLVVSCPCALGLATPVAVMVGNGVGARHGILFKTAASLEETGRLQIAVLDKTGTLTEGEPEVTDLLPAEGITENTLLQAAYSLEIKSEHPLAKAVKREAERRGLTAFNITDFSVLPGNGLKGNADGKNLLGGSVRFVSETTALLPAAAALTEKLSGEGKTPLLFTENGRFIGIIAVADILKGDAADSIETLNAMAIRTVMLTGDHPKTAIAIAKKAGIRHVIAGVLPDEKAGVIEHLKTLGKVAMIGDGINDAPALTSADTGLAIGCGTDVAIDAADVVLTNSRLSDLPASIRLSRAVLTNIRENLFWAFFYNILLIPLAAGAFSGVIGFSLNPMLSAAAMSLSSFFVVTNALRLNLFNLYAPKRKFMTKKPVDADAIDILLKEITQFTEEKHMTKTLKIEGMMCVHCEMHTKKALEAIDGVESAVADHEKGIAAVTLTKNVDEALFKAAVEEAGYTFIGIE